MLEVDHDDVAARCLNLLAEEAELENKVDAMGATIRQLKDESLAERGAHYEREKKTVEELTALQAAHEVVVRADRERGYQFEALSGRYRELIGEVTTLRGELGVVVSENVRAIARNKDTIERVKEAVRDVCEQMDVGVEGLEADG